MKKKTWKKSLAAMLGLILSIQAPFGPLVSLRQSYAYTERSAKVNASTLNVRSGPGTSNSLVKKLAKGTAVTVINETTGSDGKLWYQIRFSSSGGTSTGYVLGSYIRFPVSYTPSADFEQEMNNQGFPESYKTELRQLHAQYPNWVFEAQHTGLDWNTVIENESVLGRNLVGTESISSYKSLADGAYNWDNGTWTGFDGSSWVAASEEILKYYMDPRNFLDDVFIFQFMSQEYDPNVQTREGLENMIKGTFLEGAVKTGNISGSSGSSSSESSSGSSSTSSTGPGGSGTSSGTTSGVIVSPSGGKGGNSSRGSSSSGTTSGSSGTTSQPEVQFQGPPQASISRHEAERVTSSADSVVIGVMPGSDSGGTQDNNTAPATSPTPGTSGTVTAGTTSGTITAGASGPTASAVPGGTGASDPTDASVSGTSSYAEIIMKAAEQTGVNPYVLAAMILQEQGSDGRGRSITGTNSSYPGYYNYFNVGAYASGNMGAIERGLWYASQNDIYGRPWNTPEKSILGGAEFYAANYVNAGQNTLYLKKYNVQGSNIYKHQYMTNVDGAASEASYFAEGYAASLKDTALHFKIPVYTNMPDTPCARPTVDGSPNNKLSGLGVEGFVLTPTFTRDTVSYDLIVDPSVSSVTVYANTIDSRASVSGTGTVQLQNGNNDIRIVVTAQNGSEREYIIHVVRQSNGPTYNAGIGGNGGTSSGSGTVTPGTSGSGSSYGPGVVGPGAGSGTSSGSSGTSVIGSGGTPGGSNVIVIGE